VDSSTAAELGTKSELGTSIDNPNTNSNVSIHDTVLDPSYTLVKARNSDQRPIAELALRNSNRSETEENRTGRVGGGSDGKSDGKTDTVTQPNDRNVQTTTGDEINQENLKRLTIVMDDNAEEAAKAFMAGNSGNTSDMKAGSSKDLSSNKRGNSASPSRSKKGGFLSSFRLFSGSRTATPKKDTLAAGEEERAEAKTEAKAEAKASTNTATSKTPPKSTPNPTPQTNSKTTPTTTPQSREWTTARGEPVKKEEGFDSNGGSAMNNHRQRRIVNPAPITIEQTIVAEAKENIEGNRLNMEGKILNRLGSSRHSVFLVNFNLNT
jgi:hypothetical protein